MDTTKEIREIVAKKLIVRVKEKKNITQSTTNSDDFRIGDKIEFTLAVWNDSSFELNELNFVVQQFEAVEIENLPQQYSITNLPPKSEVPLATIRGTVSANPNDATGPWVILDRLCKVTITGEINIPPIKFQDEEIELINIKE